MYEKGSIVLLDPEYTATQTDFPEQKSCMDGRKKEAVTLEFMLPLVSRYSLLIVGSRGGAHDAHFTPMWRQVATMAASDESVQCVHTVLALQKKAAAVRCEFYSDPDFSKWAQQHIRVVVYGSQHAQLGPFLHQLASLPGLDPSNTSKRI